jgi:hypothetical protein
VILSVRPTDFRPKFVSARFAERWPQFSRSRIFHALTFFEAAATVLAGVERFVSHFQTLNLEMSIFPRNVSQMIHGTQSAIIPSVLSIFIKMSNSACS